MKKPRRKLVIDGLWGLGKTRFCEELEARGWKFIREPDHEICSLDKTIDLGAFYASSHFENMSRLQTSNCDTVLERSIFCALAYNYAIGKVAAGVSMNELKDKNFVGVEIFCFYKSLESFEEEMKKEERGGLIPEKIAPVIFYKKFLSIWEILQKKYPKNIFLILLKEGEFVSDYFRKMKSQE